MLRKCRFGALLAICVLSIGCGGKPNLPSVVGSSAQLKAVSAVQFGAVPIGGISSNFVAMTNTASAGTSVTIAQIEVTGSGFRLGPTPDFPLTLSPGQSLTVGIDFSPLSVGSMAGKVSVVGDAANQLLAVSLTGSGHAASQRGTPNGPGGNSGHSVQLSWDASTSPVVGYNIYRSSQSGGPYSKLSASPNPTTSYSDNTVQSGTTYYYVATSVNGRSQESQYSNETIAAVP